MHVEYEQCKVIDLSEFQTSNFEDSCMLWDFLVDKHSHRLRVTLMEVVEATMASQAKGPDHVPSSLVDCISSASSQNADVLYGISRMALCLWSREDISDVERGVTLD